MESLFKKTKSKVILFWTQKNADDEEENEAIDKAVEIVDYDSREKYIHIFEAHHDDETYSDLRKELIKTIQTTTEDDFRCLSHQEIVSVARGFGSHCIQTNVIDEDQEDCKKGTEAAKEVIKLLENENIEKCCSVLSNDDW